MALSDVFPRMNLPGEAMPWGRTMESRVKELEKQLDTERKFREGANRTNASSLEFLSDQLMAVVFVRPVSAFETDFALTTVYQTTSSLSVPITPGYNRCAVYASHTVGAEVVATGTDYLWSRTVVEGTSGTSVFTQGSDVAGDTWPAVTSTRSAVVAWNREDYPTDSGPVITIEGESRFQEATHAANPLNRSILTGFAIFYNEA